MKNKPMLASEPRRWGPRRLRLPPRATAAMLVVAAYCGVHSALAIGDVEDPLLASDGGIAGARRHRLVAHRNSLHKKRRLSSRGEDDDTAEDGSQRLSRQETKSLKLNVNGDKGDDKPVGGEPDITTNDKKDNSSSFPFTSSSSASSSSSADDEPNTVKKDKKGKNYESNDFAKDDKGDKGDENPVGGEPDIATKAKKDNSSSSPVTSSFSASSSSSADDEPNIAKKDKKDKNDEPNDFAKKDKKDKGDKPGIAKQDKKDEDKDDEPSITKKDKKDKGPEPSIAKQDKQDKDYKPSGDVFAINDGESPTKRKIAIIRRSQTYFGNLFPTGTVHIAHTDGESGGGTTAYDLRSVSGLDPTCDRTIEESHCLCGYCANCNLMTDPDDIANCNTLDSCRFVGHGFARPRALYLKLDNPDRNLDQITVYFKRGKSHKTGDECGEITVDRDERGLFHIERPEGCENAKKPGIGTEVSIDYTGDGEVDVSLHVSCSVPLYAGMMFEGSPFVLEGYCVGEAEGGGCTHIDQGTGGVCTVGHPADVATAPPTSGPTVGPTHSPTTLPPTTAEPSAIPTISPTHAPTASPARRKPLYNVTDDNGNPLFDPNSPFVAYTSNNCGPRGPNAYFNNREACPRGFMLIKRRFGTEGEVVAVIDRCHYYSFQVFKCIDRAPFEDQPTVTLPSFEPQPIEDSRASKRDAGLLFDPKSTLVSYTSANCGPRGPSAEANYGTEKCPYGYMKVEEDFGSSRQGGVVIATVDGCQYFSFQVYQCLPSLTDRPLGRRALNHDVVDSLSILPTFDPRSTLTGYISEDCGPRGKYALADLEQCEPDGHEKIEFVPWQDGRVVAEIDGCAYFSIEVYQCLPSHSIDILHDQSVSGADTEAETGEDFNEGIEFTTSCAVLVADGSCSEPEAASGFFVGTTTKDELVKDSQYDAEQLDGKVVLFHDYYGTVIGCGTIRPII